MEETRVTTGDGASLWVGLSGAGPPLVINHGGPGLWDYFDEFSAEMEDLVTVIRWEQRGCGRSYGGIESHSISQYVDDLEAIRLHFGFDRWTVGGHSWGATLALQYALKHPDRTASLVYLSGVGVGQSWDDAFRIEHRRRLGDRFDRWDDLAHRSRSTDEETEYRRLSWSIDFFDRSRAEELAGMIDRPFLINTLANKAISKEMSSWVEGSLILQCSQLDIPALVVHGAEDPRPVWAVDSLVKALPNVMLLVLDNAGHSPWLEAKDRFYKPLRDFLRGTLDQE